MNRKLASILALGFASASSPALAQLQLPRLPVIIPRSPNTPPPQPMMPSGMLQADLVAKSGGDTVFFSPRGYTLDANAVARLTAQARWLLANPMVSVRLEGHGDARDPRDYAIAIGDRRANAVREFLLLQGVAPQRISTVSWGKERPGKVRVGPSIVSVGPRVVTVVQ